jgi:ankyrin repeat protein
LSSAIDNIDGRIAMFLLDNGADPNWAEPGEWGTCPLAAAAGVNYQYMVRFLLEKGASINLGDKTALAHATFKGHMDMVHFLLEKAADINLMDKSFGSALCAAVRGKHIGICRLLLQKGANVNMEVRFYGSALGFAAKGWTD